MAAQTRMTADESKEAMKHLLENVITNTGKGQTNWTVRKYLTDGEIDDYLSFVQTGEDEIRQDKTYWVTTKDKDERGRFIDKMKDLSMGKHKMRAKFTDTLF